MLRKKNFLDIFSLPMVRYEKENFIHIARKKRSTIITLIERILMAGRNLGSVVGR